jgi:hypothetical protein
MGRYGVMDFVVLVATNAQRRRLASEGQGSGAGPEQRVPQHTVQKTARGEGYPCASRSVVMLPGTRHQADGRHLVGYLAARRPLESGTRPLPDTLRGYCITGSRGNPATEEAGERWARAGGLTKSRQEADGEAQGYGERSSSPFKISTRSKRPASHACRRGRIRMSGCGFRAHGKRRPAHPA